MAHCRQGPQDPCRATGAKVGRQCRAVARRKEAVKPSQNDLEHAARSDASTGHPAAWDDRSNGVFSYPGGGTKDIEGRQHLTDATVWEGPAETDTCIPWPHAPPSRSRSPGRRRGPRKCASTSMAGSSRRTASTSTWAPFQRASEQYVDPQPRFGTATDSAAAKTVEINAEPAVCLWRQSTHSPRTDAP